MTLEAQAAKLSQREIIALLEAHNSYAERERQIQAKQAELERENQELKLQVQWWERQYFGEKSEKRIRETDPRQLSFVEGEDAPPEPAETVKGHQRRKRGKKRLEDQVTSEGLRFGPDVPVKTISVPNPELEGLKEGEDYEVIGTRETHKLAQRSPYVILRFVRQVVKLLPQKKIRCAPAPQAVLERSYADVSFLAGLLVDKFVYHLPLYRQHQRLTEAGILLSRQTLTNSAARAIELLEPVYYSQLSSILMSEVLLMDETPVKAGLKCRKKMKQGYFWPVYGDKDEVAFPFAASRKHKEVGKILGSYAKTLVTDGYEAYDRFAEKTEGLTHAQCWSHTRRAFLKAQSTAPPLVEEALRRIGKLYEFEDDIRQKKLTGGEKLAYRALHSRGEVTDFFFWLQAVMKRECLEPSNRFSKAANYALERQAGLEIFLSDPQVPIDTNEIERTIRPIPLGRKNWLFCWTELGAEHLGKIQSLLQTCRLQGVDPYTWLVDVLQRVDSHPAIDVHLLTPRLWKQNFADNPLRSPIDL